MPSCWSRIDTSVIDRVVLAVEVHDVGREAEAEDLEQAFRWNLGGWSRENHELIHALNHGTVKIVRFVRFERGEGVAKEEKDDFAAEVAKMAGG